VSGRLDPAVAAVRGAVRLAMADVEPGQRVLVACSGGADSMALAAAAAFEGHRAAWSLAALIVDHGLRKDSEAVAATVADRLRTMQVFAAFESVDVVRVQVGTQGSLEAAAREARYAALEASAERQDAVVLLGHTRDDQAETVLLGLARGSGLRSLAGMRQVVGRYRRPLLGITRAQTEQACRALEVPVWLDPDNSDERFTRVRVRRKVLPMLETELGPGVSGALARTAEQAAADADTLDALAADLFARTWSASALRLADLAGAPAALRRRVLRLAALAAGCPGGDLSAVHVNALDALVMSWHGQRGVDLPGSVTAVRRGEVLELTRRRSE
jgi:tRNA(Ile)-lysidine synthase